jgi:hypothetical protein
MKPEDMPSQKCPLCGHTPCEVLDIGSDHNIDVSDTHRPLRPTIHAKCPSCGAEFHITVVGK